MLQIQCVQILGKGHFLSLQVCGQFAEHDNRSIGIFVAHLIARQIAIALLTAKDEISRVIQHEVGLRPDITSVVIDDEALLLKKRGLHLGLISSELFADPFKAGQGIYRLQAMPGGDSFLHRAGDESFDQDGVVPTIFGDNLRIFQGGDTILGQQCADLIAGK